MVEGFLANVIEWVEYVYTTYYYSIISAIIFVLVGFIIGKLLGRLVHRTLHSMEVDTILKKAMQTNVKLEQPLATVTSFLIYTIAIIMALNQLQVTTTILQMIIAGVILVIIIAAAFAVKDFIPNAVAGFYLLKNNVIKEGQVISVKGVKGKVIAVTLIETKLQTKEGNLVHIPNSSITKAEIVTLKKNLPRAKYN
ncbi:mechanosensitive ion channel [Candidatus Woesearchaeota archaeon]|nr:mechanosensitive ion channel [Candidatus Woesearchaeota archaeon]